MLYDVTDKGIEYSYGVRGSCTNVELLYHTDNAFGLAPPAYVGLLCLQPALSGGVSQFCCLATVHLRMFESRPDLLARRHKPMLWDRQAEHAPGASHLSRVLMFYRDEQGLGVRVNPSLVRQAYALIEAPLDDELDRALSYFQALTEDPAMWIEAPIERGQLQYLNNRSVAHYRSEFEDDAEQGSRRHLVRTWHRASGSVAYDG